MAPYFIPSEEMLVCFLHKDCDNLLMFPTVKNLQPHKEVKIHQETNRLCFEQQCKYFMMQKPESPQ